MATASSQDQLGVLALLGVAGQGALALAPQDFAVVGAIPGSVLKTLFLERLKYLQQAGILTAQQVQAFKDLISGIEGGTPPPLTQSDVDPTTPVTAESIIRTAIVTRAGSGEESLFGFLADAFITIGGGIYGLATEGSMDGFVSGASMAHQWAQDHLPA